MEDELPLPLPVVRIGPPFMIHSVINLTILEGSRIKTVTKEFASIVVGSVYMSTLK